MKIPGDITAKIYTFFFIVVFSVSCGRQGHIFHSPDGDLSVEFRLINGEPSYTLQKNGKKILDSSRLGLSLKDSLLKAPYLLEKITSRSFDTIWYPVVGKTSRVRNHYNEWVVSLTEKASRHHRLEIIFRLYNEGIGIRYRIPEQEGLDTFTITKDLTTFHFPGKVTWWSANGEHANLGPLPSDSFPARIPLPFVGKLCDTAWVAIHEAAIYHYAPFLLTKQNMPHTLGCKMSPSSGKAGVPLSWRVVFTDDHPGAFLESSLLENLNPPCKIEDPSWIKPGKSMWDWRVWGYKTDDGFTYGLNTVSHKRFVDFASKHHIRYMLLDADWYGPEFDKNSDPTQARKGIDIEDFMEYARNMHVGVILYLNDVGAKKYGMDTIFSRFRRWGARGVKYGFMTGEGQEKVLHTRKVVRLCASHHLLVNFHDNPVPPSGDTRTWPNLIAREYCHSQADAKRSYWPETAVSAAFINMLSGPLDMDNGWFDLDHAQARERVFEPIPGTVAAEAAKMVVFWSGLMILPDAPEEYEKKADLFNFIENLPDSYDEIKVLGGSPDTHIILARRKDRNWYLGCLTNRESRTLKIPLSFLKEKKEYKITLYEDAPDSHYLNNKEDYRILQLTATADMNLEVTLAPGGGCALRIKEKN